VMRRNGTFTLSCRLSHRSGALCSW